MTKGNKEARFHKLCVGTLPDELYNDSVPAEKWLEHAESTNDADGFPANSLNRLAPIDSMVELERVVGIALWMVGNILPFALFGLGVGSIFSKWARVGTIIFLGYVGILSAIEELIFKPHFLKKYNLKKMIGSSVRENQYLFTERNTSKYLNTTLVWPNSIHPPSLKDQPVIFCLVPHGAAPLGATAYAMWSKLWSSKLCHWTCAPILFSIPFVGYFMKQIGYIPAKSKQILETLQKKEESVGVFLDGIAGMFQTGSLEERAVLAQRKGIVKIALKAGVPIIPVYAFGHSDTYTVMVDPFGILETLSVTLQASLTPIFGRWGWFLGPPRRVPVTLTLGEPITCPLTAEPTKEEINQYHEKMVKGFEAVFEKHKGAYGWPNKKLKVV